MIFIIVVTTNIVTNINIDITVINITIIYTPTSINTTIIKIFNITIINISTNIITTITTFN